MKIRRWNLFFKDPEFWFIIGFNAMIIGLYLNNSYNKNIVIWGYYMQSVFIGLQYVLISLVKHIKNYRSLLPLNKLRFVGFFILHYGLFHFVYFIFLLAMFVGDNSTDISALLTFIETSLVFLAVNTLVLTGRELLPGVDDYPKPSIIVAYARIVPIHLLIIIAGFQKERMAIAFLVFMFLKVLFDLLTYIVTMPDSKDQGDVKSLW